MPNKLKALALSLTLFASQAALAEAEFGLNCVNKNNKNSGVIFLSFASFATITWFGTDTSDESQREKLTLTTKTAESIRYTSPPSYKEKVVWIVKRDTLELTRFDFASMSFSCMKSNDVTALTKKSDEVIIEKQTRLENKKQNDLRMKKQEEQQQLKRNQI